MELKFSVFPYFLIYYSTNRRLSRSFELGAFSLTLNRAVIIMIIIIIKQGAT